MRRSIMILCALLAIAVGNAQSLSKLAYEAYDNAEYDKVLEYTTEQLKYTPKDIDMRVLRVLTYVQIGECDQAIEELGVAIKRWNKKSSYSKGRLYGLRAMLYDECQGNAELAVADFNKSVKVDKNNPLCYYARGCYYYDLDEYDKAEADLRKAFELNPEDSEVAFKLVRNLMLEQKFDEAAQLLDALSFNKEDVPTALFLRAYIYLWTDDLHMAVDTYISYLSVEPEGETQFLTDIAEVEYDYVLKKITDQVASATDDESREYWQTFRVRMLMNRKQYQAALEELETMQALIPDSTTRYIQYQKSGCYEGLEQYDKAVECYDKLLELDGGELGWVYHYYRAIDYSMMEQYDKAEKDYTAMIEDPEAMEYSVLEAKHHRGTIRELYLKQYDEALADYNDVLAEDSTLSSILLARGRVLLYQKKDTAAAYADFRRVLDLETAPESAAHQFALVFMGFYEPAMVGNQNMLLNDPDANDFYNSACLYARMNKKTEALEFLKKALEMGFKEFVHLSLDPDLDSIRNTKEYKALIKQYKK